MASINREKWGIEMTKPIEIAKQAEREINDLGHGYNQPSARLYVVSDGGISGVEMRLASEHGDVYELLDSQSALEVAQSAEYIGLVTCGWASPITDDSDESVPPSQHPERRRVRLFVLANRHATASVLRFSDEPDEIVTDEGKAIGSLADAVHTLFVRAKAITN